MAALALADVLADIPDPRSRHGRVHPLGAAFGLVVLGLLMGKRSLSAIARLGRNYGPPLAHALGFRRGKTPAQSTLSEILRDTDAQAVEDGLARWVGSRLPEGVAQLALDGKAVRGSRDGELPGQHLLAAYAPQAEAILAQMRVDGKTNEHKGALRLLGILPLAGRVKSHAAGRSARTGSPSRCRRRRLSPAPSVTRRQVEADRRRPARRGAAGRRHARTAPGRRPGPSAIARPGCGARRPGPASGPRGKARPGKGRRRSRRGSAPPRRWQSVGCGSGSR